MSLSFCRRPVQVASLAGLLLLCGGCDRSATEPPAAAGAASAAVAAAPAPVYAVGVDAAYAPFGSLAENGDIVGFEIELVRAVARKAGIEVRFVNTPWEVLFGSLAQGQLDILASAVTVTDERKLEMDFSAPYFVTRQLIAVKDSSRATRFSDLSRLRVGVQIGALADDAVTGLLGANNPQIKRFGSTAQALQDLQAGGVDAVVGDSGVLLHHQHKHPAAALRMLAEPALGPRHYAIAVRKGQAELLDKLNQGLAGIRLDGSYDALHARYFGPVQAAGGTAVRSAAGVVAPADAAAGRP